MGTEYIQVAGKSNIHIGDSDYSSGGSGDDVALAKLGEQMDDTVLEVQRFKHNVPGDRHGGPQGPPIEIQDLGVLVRGTLNLSRFDPDLMADLQGQNVNATIGKVESSEVGTLLLLENAYRIVIEPMKDNTSDALSYDPFFYNFVCCVIASPVVVNQGTKFSTLRLTFEAHRAPDGHDKAGFVWDRDDMGLPT